MKKKAKDNGSNKALKEVKILTQGETFGEMALLGNGHRSATIESKEMCYFGVLDKSNFLLFLSTYYYLSL